MKTSLKIHEIQIYISISHFAAKIKKKRRKRKKYGAPDAITVFGS